VVTVSLLLVSERNESKLAPAGLLIDAPAEAIPLPLPEPAREETMPTGLPEEIELEVGAELDPVPIADGAALLELVVRRGENLDTLFRRNKLALADLSAMASLEEVGEHLKLLKPGDEIRIAHRDGEIVSLRRELDEIKLLSIERSTSGFNAAIIERAVEVRTVGAHGVIQSSLFEAGAQAGISDAVTMSMAGIFQWDVDFLQDVRIGDEFTVVHEELWRDGVKIRNGEIIAAEFVNRGTSYRAARYTDGSGRSDYYTPEGRSVRKAFVRAPVDFTRISSNFDLKRRHPILNTIRAHRGVDYAAPTGTPIKAAGDGKVTFRGVKGGYGNTVVLQHGGNITTLYGHLSRFAKPKVGSRVRQGEVIGYVGKSGLATGPHLHYEYQVNGAHRNPRTVPLPPADPIPAEYLEDFQRSTASLWQQLELYAGGSTQLASAQN
jgi:murein DD-endopeptidase MepM/ murein hydrolase activator NlpD